MKFPIHKWIFIWDNFRKERLAKCFRNVYNNLCLQDATVAQLVEQLIRNQQVRGSSPLSSFGCRTKLVRQLFFVLMLKPLQQLIECQSNHA